MGCEYIKLPDGVEMIVCSRGRRAKRCACGRPAELLCDAPKGSTGKRTCSRPLCAACTTKNGAVDMCPDHAPKRDGRAPPERRFAVTLWRPWAWAMAHGSKRVENRGTPLLRPALGGWLALHAGKTWDYDGAAKILGVHPEMPRSAGEHPVGIVAVARVRCEYCDPSGLPDDQRRWFFGPFGYLCDVTPLPRAVPCRGAQGLWPLPPDVLAAVRSQWKAARDG